MIIEAPNLAESYSDVKPIMSFNDLLGEDADQAVSEQLQDEYYDSEV